MSWVLVVDDSEIVREMVSTELRLCGFDVVVANNGLDAILAIQNYPPDLVITDVVMPQMNGYELCRWIKTYYQNIPVIFCSAKGEEFDRYWGIKQGADAYMVKPCPRSEMLDAINRLLAQSSSELN
ncbi:response regulator [Cyanobacteria bacterium FACHB-63]|nr:response regulator [Cyanobacteria bacterium FACHB-63]